MNGSRTIRDSKGGVRSCGFPSALPGCPRCGRMVVFAYLSEHSPGFRIYGCRRCGNVVYGRSNYLGRLTR